MPNTLTVYTTILVSKNKPWSLLIGICRHFCYGLKLSIENCDFISGERGTLLRVVLLRHLYQA